jgi:hypothetical protein
MPESRRLATVAGFGRYYARFWLDPTILAGIWPDWLNPRPLGRNLGQIQPVWLGSGRFVPNIHWNLAQMAGFQQKYFCKKYFYIILHYYFLNCE